MDGASPIETSVSEADLEALIERYSRLMAAAVRRVVSQPELLPDIRQEIHLALLKRLRTGRDIRHPSSYVYKVALTTARTVVQRYASQEQNVDTDVLDTTPLPGGEDRMKPVERRILVKEVLNMLPKEQAVALRCYLGGLNHAEVARFCGWTESVARHRIYRALETLRERAEGAKR
ncbi:hypothetical protein ABI59_13675 [Acidobacteria bacterium Mor1]|nr:hypothetical protein ABI59_13675 [Acidobacteria bacterium Mor1]